MAIPALRCLIAPNVVVAEIGFLIPILPRKPQVESHCRHRRFHPPHPRLRQHPGGLVVPKRAVRQLPGDLVRIVRDLPWRVEVIGMDGVNTVVGVQTDGQGAAVFL